MMALGIVTPLWPAPWELVVPAEYLCVRSCPNARRIMFYAKRLRLTTCMCHSRHRQWACKCVQGTCIT